MEVPCRIRHQRVGLVPDSVFHDVPHSRSSSLALSQLTDLFSIRLSDVLRRFLPKLAEELVLSSSSLLLLFGIRRGDLASDDTLDGNALGTALAGAIGNAQMRKDPKKARKSVLEDNLPLSDRRRSEKTATDEGGVLPEAASPERDEAVS